jgi:hypothetical protein
MGISAVDINDMSLWEFMAQVDGYVDANTPESEKNKKPLSEDEFDALARFID